MVFNKKAEMGIGTLILFIAFILVAAVAAAVLVSTTQAVQSKALQTGKDTLAEVGTSMVAVELYAEDGTTNNNVNMFFQTLKLSAGSDPVRFQDLLLTFSTSTTSSSYTYNGTSSDCTTVPAGSSSTFGSAYLLQGGSNTAGYLYPGDVALICWNYTGTVGESSSIKSSIIPKTGSPLVVDTTTPQLITQKRVYIYP